MGVELREKNGSILHRTTECDPQLWLTGRTNGLIDLGADLGMERIRVALWIVALCSSRAAAERKLNNGFPLPPAISWVDCHSRDRVTLQSHSDRPYTCQLHCGDAHGNCQVFADVQPLSQTTHVRIDCPFPGS